MVLSKNGKFSTREGNIIKLEDLLDEAIERVKKIIEEKNEKLENKDEVQLDEDTKKCPNCGKIHEKNDQICDCGCILE